MTAPDIVGSDDRCSTGGVDARRAEDVVHRFRTPDVAAAPVHGTEHPARHRRAVAGRIGAGRVTDHCLAAEAVIGRTWRPPGATERIATHGVERSRTPPCAS